MRAKKEISVERIWNVLFCGTGGQGVLTASEICAVVAMNAGFHVKKSEVHGMAQRGGSVESHLRFGAKVSSPLIRPGQADYIVCFHEGEGQRMNGFLKKGGLSFLSFLTDPQFQPRDKRFGNTFALGILSAFLPMTEETWRAALKKMLKRSLVENEQAFTDGRSAGFAWLGRQKA
ncbi:MAG TPA: 2-oxoacid:acceptor oxidoreductase family protein [Chitinivibrionales bacterium]|nr:2-oxoacid:acceptor oxidoreductase family protein [Chitinivibrionales bacterium]